MKLKQKKIMRTRYITKIYSHDSGSVLSNVIYQVDAGPYGMDGRMKWTMRPL